VWFQVFYAVKGGTGTQDPQFSNQIDATARRNANTLVSSDEFSAFRAVVVYFNCCQGVNVKN
jgi:hypothetical protein